MPNQEKIKTLEKEVVELSKKIELLNTRTNAQYTEIMSKLDGASQENTMDDETLYAEAKKIVIASQKASVSFLQRKLKIGYARAARLVDTLEENSVVGPGQGAVSREILAKK
ncbi:MAG: DNA translocase FtsK [Patescibacteria group bacterium]